MANYKNITNEKLTSAFLYVIAFGCLMSWQPTSAMAGLCGSEVGQATCYVCSVLTESTADDCCGNPEVFDACQHCLVNRQACRQVGDVSDGDEEEDASKRAKYMLGKRGKPFLGKRGSGWDSFSSDVINDWPMKRQKPFLGKRDEDINKRPHHFLGKRVNAFLGKRSPQQPSLEDIRNLYDKPLTRRAKYMLGKRSDTMTSQHGQAFADVTNAEESGTRR